MLGGHSDYRDQDQQDDTSEYYYYISDYDYNEAENTGIDLQSVKPKLWETKPMYEYVYNRELKETQKGKQYTKDETTGLWIQAVTKETCEASDGFVCNVSLDVAEGVCSRMYENDESVL